MQFKLLLSVILTYDSPGPPRTGDGELEVGTCPDKIRRGDGGPLLWGSGTSGIGVCQMKDFGSSIRINCALRTRFEEVELLGFVLSHVGQVGTVSFDFFDKVSEKIDDHRLVTGGEGGENVHARRLSTVKKQVTVNWEGCSMGRDGDVTAEEDNVL
ncbi:hypothetical protein ARMSODRAFT_974661 [Armillaria solidipes]|uniref:Uncharacterized protein n=1 Tax=Armillaria solidipes TaxID=1076256 RepID=A0A2H3C220_9AGAR|nr:hypothetical protein ARMSODRAFT_974661 [Armillaria solidipes]